jgi:thioredoxin-like negative regulator of GroEL
VRPQTTTRQRSPEPTSASGLPALLFVRQSQDGASRRMESLVAWVKVTQKKRLRVIAVDADRNPALTRELKVTEIPSLVLIKDRRVVGRLEGRATGRQIDELIRPHLAA